MTCQEAASRFEAFGICKTAAQTIVWAAAFYGFSFFWTLERGLALAATRRDSLSIWV